MREIKFRAYEKDSFDETGKMIHAEDFMKNWNIGFLFLNPSTNPCNRLKIMQYTGLKDKNGKEIYEGDIVAEDEEMHSVCKWINPLGCFAFVPIEMNGESGDNLRGYTEFNKVYEMFIEYGVDTFFYNQTPNKYVEVIGNIYENPELLNQQ